MSKRSLNGALIKNGAIASAILAISLGIFWILGTTFNPNREPIDQRVIWGCYVADGAPALAVEQDLIRILDGTGRTLRYTVQSENDYQLTVTPALELERTDDGRLRFDIGTGTGYFWPLLRDSSDFPRRMRSARDFGGRILLVTRERDGVVYVRRPSRRMCR